jgi:hypothetical protein
MNDIENMNDIEKLKNDFFSILELLKKEMDEMKQDIYSLKEKEVKKDMNEYNKLLSNYVPFKEKSPKTKKIIDEIEYIIDNNLLFNELGEIVGKIEKENEIIWINKSD